MSCRPSETFALTWNDIDWKNGTVAFYKASRRVEGGIAISAGTKNGEISSRTLPLGEVLTDLLRRVQKARMAHGMASEWVFLSLKGLGLNQGRMRARWKAMKKSLGLPDGPCLYCLKKSGNSFAGREGTPSEVRGLFMGHTSDRMAKTDYRIIIRPELEKAVNAFDERVER